MPSVERRFEIRESGANAIEGVCVRFGDFASLPWGAETIRAGAFGNVAELDVLLNVSHDRKRVLARTKGGGLVLTDSPSELSFRAELPNTSEASDTLELVRSGVYRGASIEFFPTEERVSKDALGKPVTEIIRADLVGLAICAKPAYSQSTIEARMAHVAALGKDHAGGAPSSAPQREFDGARRIFL